MRRKDQEIERRNEKDGEEGMRKKWKNREKGRKTLKIDPRRRKKEDSE